MNAFNGSKFYYAREHNYPPEPARQAPGGRRRQLPYRHYRYQHQLAPSSMEDTFSRPSDSSSTGNSDDSTRGGRINSTADDRALDQSESSNGLSSSEQKARSLLVEFTPSLFQSKELNLKCKTLVEQPLIEYDSQLVASVALNPFIQVDPTVRLQRPPGVLTHSIRNNQNQQQQQQQQQGRQHGRLYNSNQRNRNGFMRPQQSSSSSVSSNRQSSIITIVFIFFSTCICINNLLGQFYRPL